MTDPTELQKLVPTAIKATEYKYFGDYEMSDDQRKAVDTLVAVAQSFIEQQATIARLTAERDEARAALEPFAAMGRVMEARARITFGRVIDDHQVVSESSGEAGTGILTMGHFRDAADLLPNAPAWGGRYKSLRRARALVRDRGGE